MQLSLEVAPDTGDQEAVAAGRALGEALAAPLHAAGAAGRGFAWLPADEALAGAVIEVSERPMVVSNVDFSGQRVGGLKGDVVARFLAELAAGASLNIHIRVLEGREPQNVLLAIFKALGAATGQACRGAEEGGRP
jgi:imidazoleglycerol-phosphate dehydratase